MLSDQACAAESHEHAKALRLLGARTCTCNVGQVCNQARGDPLEGTRQAALQAAAAATGASTTPSTRHLRADVRVPVSYREPVVNLFEHQWHKLRRRPATSSATSCA